MSKPTEVYNFLDAKVDANGIVRWKSNGRVPPQDVLDNWNARGFSFDMAASAAQRAKEFAAFAANYRKTAKPPTDEEMFEMRAAFGPGVKVVNLITGKKIQL